MSEVLTVYHGSKNGLKGPIRMVGGRNRQTCDFGQGFYMGDEPTQPRTLICDGKQPTLYTISLDLEGLKVHRFKTDADWAIFVAYNRGFLENYRKTAFYRELKRIREVNDIIFGRIANDRIFAAMRLFFDGLIGVPALVKCLSALNVGNQYCAISRKAFSQIAIVSEKRFSSRECELFKAKSERQRKRAVAAANEICVAMRREGESFLDLVKRRMVTGSGEAVTRPLRSGKGKRAK